MAFEEYWIDFQEIYKEIRAEGMNMLNPRTSEYSECARAESRLISFIGKKLKKIVKVFTVSPQIFLSLLAFWIYSIMEASWHGRNSKSLVNYFLHDKYTCQHFHGGYL